MSAENRQVIEAYFDALDRLASAELTFLLVSYRTWEANWCQTPVPSLSTEEARIELELARVNVMQTWQAIPEHLRAKLWPTPRARTSLTDADLAVQSR